MRAFGRDLIRGGHYGQRSCEPRQQAEHMAAPTNAAKREESSCQLGAVHTWAPSEHIEMSAIWSLSGPKRTSASDCRTSAIYEHTPQPDGSVVGTSLSAGPVSLTGGCNPSLLARS